MPVVPESLSLSSEVEAVSDITSQDTIAEQMNDKVLLSILVL